MPKKDISRRAVEKAVGAIERTQGLMSKRFAYGPTSAGLTRREMRQELQKLTAEQKQSLVSQNGWEWWDKLMGDIYGPS